MADPAAPAAPPKLRILVAEDNPINARLITFLLEEMGHQTQVAGNGEEAIGALQRAAFDLVLMDVQMPVMDGLAATRQIVRDWPEAERPRIVALTAGDQQQQACRDAGMTDYLSKPLEPDQLERLLARLFGGR